MPSYQITQTFPVEIGETYQIAYTVVSPAWGVTVSVSPVGRANVYTKNLWHTSAVTIIETFVATSLPGESLFNVVIENDAGDTTGVPEPLVIVENISIRKKTPATSGNLPIKELFSGDTDEGDVIHFRADTQVLQIQPGLELNSTPIAVVSEMERGSQVKVFVSLDDQNHYQLEGTATKGISILKFRPNRDGTDIAQLGKTIQISYRDSSKNLCRIIQSALITIPTPIDYSP